MIVLRKTMDAAVAAEVEKRCTAVGNIARRYGNALETVAATQYQLAAWVEGKAEAFTPEQFAALFYARDDRFQAAFFNALPAAIKACSDAQPEARPGEYRPYVGPDGEGQWAWMVDHLDDAGFAVLESMFELAKLNRERVAA